MVWRFQTKKTLTMPRNLRASVPRCELVRGADAVDVLMQSRLYLFGRLKHSSVGDEPTVISRHRRGNTKRKENVLRGDKHEW